MAAMEFPLHESFFPQIVLNAEEIKYYKRLGKERLNQLMRIAEDADYAYKWTETRTRHGTSVQRTQFLDFRPATKATYASMLLKTSVLIPDTHAEELLQAIAKAKTKEYRKMMRFLHGPAFVDGRTLFKFPSSIAASRPEYSYRAIKWCALRGKGRDENKSLDFAFLEYAGRRKATPGSMVVGFCVQESIQREREVPMLEEFGIVRGYMSRAGMIVSKTHQPSVLRVTSICQIDGDIEPVVRGVLEEIMQESVGAVVRLRGLLDRQRVSSMKFKEQWEWVANSDRKACAVCLKGFFFHRKHHCRACGEVVCSSCAPFRELEEPIYDISQLRVCTNCMTKAGRERAAQAPESSNERLAETMTSEDSGSFDGAGSRGPKNPPSSLEDRIYQQRENMDRVRRPSDAAKLLLDNSGPKSTPKSKRRLSTLLKNPKESVATLANLVDQIRTARDTINITISEAGDSRMSFGEDDAYNDLYERVTKLRETVEFSVKDGSTADDGHRPGRTSPIPGITHTEFSEQLSMGPDGPDIDTAFHLPEDVNDQFSSVLQLTFEAARATRDAGELVLSSCASELEHSSDEEGVEDVLPSPSTNYSGSDASKDPFAPANYERVMARFGSDRDSVGTSLYDDVFSTATGTSATRSQSGRARSSRVRLLEKKIEELQRDLQDAHRKLSFFEEPEPEYRSGGLGVVPEEHSSPAYYAEPHEGERYRRPSFRQSLPQQPPQRRLSDFSARTPREVTSQRFEKPPPAFAPGSSRTRPKSDSLLKIEMASRRSLDASTFERRAAAEREPYEYQRRGSEFVPRPSVAAATTSRASSGGRALSHADMVAELYGVMNSSEMTKSALPPRKASMKASHGSSGSYTSPPRKQSSLGDDVSALKRSRPPPPPPPVSMKTMYVDDSGRLLPGTPSSGSSPRTGNNFDKTASSSASYAHLLEGSERSGSSLSHSVLSQSGHSGVSSTRYNAMLAENPIDDEDTSSDGDVYELAGYAQQQHQPAPHSAPTATAAAAGRAQTDRIDRERDSQSRGSQFFGELDGADRAFFGQHVVPTASPRGGGGAIPPRPVPVRRGSVMVPRHSAAMRGGRDESDELRDLMEGLIRPRSNSVPFRTTTTTAAAATAGPREPPMPVPTAPAPSRRLSIPRPPSSSATAAEGPARRLSSSVDGVVAEVRACLSALHRECPSQWERHRKLNSIFNILQSLHKDDIRSKFRTLDHNDIRYSKVLEETPSIIKLLKLAGYVSMPHKLTMRQVDAPYLRVFLDEIEAEIHRMQASQDYL